jgi:hypothetical protein
MANYAFKDADIYYGDVDMTSYSNQVALELTADSLDNTTFGDSYRSRIGGLVDGNVTLAGFADSAAADPDHHLFTSLGAEGIFTVGPQGDTVDNTGYSMKVRQFTYQAGGSVGELHGFNVTAQVSDGVGAVRGDFLVAKADISATANGTAVNVGAISSTQTGYGVLHVFSGTASTLDVKIQSDTSGFPSATDRITFTQATGPTSQWSTVAGAVTDTYWRAVYTLGGGTWNFCVLFGIK